MSEKRFTYRWGSDIDYEQEIFYDNHKPIGFVEVVNKLNEQQDQISYWKHKVSSLLWILGLFDEQKVKKLLEELEDECEKI